MKSETAPPAKAALLKVRRQLGIAEAVPLYEHVKRKISEAILLGKWPPGTVLPTESVLAQTMGVALGTVRRALSELTAEGLISRRRKTGTVVTGRKPHHSLRMCFQYFRLHGPNDSLVRSTAKVADYHSRSVSAEEAAILNIPEAAPIHVIERVRWIDGEAIMHDQIRLPVSIAPEIKSAADVPSLLLLHLLEHYGVRISAIREKIGADMSNDRDRQLLERTGIFPVLTIDETAFDQHGNAVILSIHRAVTGKFNYINEIS